MRKNYTEKIENYLLECLPTIEQISTDYSEIIEDTIQARLKFVVSCFTSEYCYPENLKRYGNKTNTFKEWLMGLPSVFSVDFENYRIIEIGKEWGKLAPNANDKQEDKFLDQWFNLCATNFAKLCRKHKVDF